MARFVMDSSTLLHLVEADLTVDPDHKLAAPNSIRTETLQRLFDEVRAGERSEKVALEMYEGMTRLKMRLLGDRVSRTTAWQMARGHGWDTLRDAEYLAITHLQADALVTLDPDWLPRCLGSCRLLPSKRSSQASTSTYRAYREGDVKRLG